MRSTSKRLLSFVSVLLLVSSIMTSFAEAPIGVDYSAFSEAELLSAYEAVTKQLEQLGYRFVIERDGPAVGDDIEEVPGEALNKEQASITETIPEAEQYAKALELEEAADNEKALALFAALGDYRDARERTLANAALYAQVLFDANEFRDCQELLLQYPSETTAELLSKCNDQVFLLDLASALSARWDNANKDTTLMSEKKLIEYHSSLVNGELFYIGKYSEMEFSDPELKEHAQNYLGALQSQLTGITEYYGKDKNAYYEYWTESGYIKRAIAIFWLNQKYGIELDSKYEEIYKEFVMNGLYYDELNSIKNMLEKQLFAIDFTMKKGSSDNSAELSSFKIINTSRYSIESISIKVQYLDAMGGNVSEGYLYSNYNGVKADSVMVTDPASIYNDFFDSLAFVYEFRVSDSRQSETVTGTIKPKVQYKWNGRITKDGAVVGGQEIIELEDLLSGWDTKSSLYVPYLKFSVKNTGTADADKIIARTVYINNKTKEIWDTDTNYVVGSSDAPLKPGYSKKVFSYAGVGFKSKLSPSLLPDLNVEVYINDVLVLTEAIIK